MRPGRLSINAATGAAAVSATAIYASDPAASRGRVHAETALALAHATSSATATAIIHATRFRRLKGKTQVFLAGEGDHYRTRLTHTLEVAQIARSLARALGLDEDLTEAIALAHDLGHPPFGHAGERALDRATAAFGGFDHNIQSLRVVTRLEHRYPRFDGLNLTWEVLEGLAKHNGPLTDRPEPLRRRPYRRPIAELDAWRDLSFRPLPAARPSARRIADDIAYDAHDIDDGLRSGLLDAWTSLADVAAAWRRISAEIEARLSRPRPRAPRCRELVRRLINGLVEDVLAETRPRLADPASRRADDLRRAGRPVSPSRPPWPRPKAAIKRYLNAELYRSPPVTEVMTQAEDLVAGLFDALLGRSAALAGAVARRT